MNDTRLKPPPSFEELYDFPISWDWWRYYKREEMQDDPGPNDIPDDEGNDERT